MNDRPIYPTLHAEYRRKAKILDDLVGIIFNKGQHGEVTLPDGLIIRVNKDANNKAWVEFDRLASFHSGRSR